MHPESTRVLMVAAMLLLLAAARASAQPAPLSLTAVRAALPPTIDGRLDDAVWKTTARISQLVQLKPAEGAPASEATDVYIGYDSQAIYVGIHAHYRDTGMVRATRADRDATSNDDTVAVSFDPFRDQQRGYSFSVNGYGVQSDALIGGGGGGVTVSDATWNVLFRSAGILVEDGWTAEMAIPIKSLRYPSRPAGEPHTWGFQVQREIRNNNETSTWAPLSNNIPGVLAQMGMLSGMRDLSTARNLEVLPTATTVATERLASGAIVKDDIAEAGLNVKYGLSSNLTLDVTVNPDFSQIESDRPQIEINQRFPLFFPELRPFFLEGQEIFRVNGPFYFLHTRTVLDPQLGVKLTGKSGKTSFGLLAANDQAPGRLDDPRAAGFGKAARVISGRVRHDVGRESFVGVIANDRAFGGGHSRLAVFDGSFRFWTNYRLQLTSGLTRHLDARGVRRNGHMSDIGFLKMGRSFGFALAENTISPDYRNDTGFQARTNFRRLFTNVSYRWWPQSWVINWGPRIAHNRLYDFNGVLNDQDTTLTMQAALARNITLSGSGGRILERFQRVDFHKTRYTASATINTSRAVLVKADLSVGDEVRFLARPYLGHSLVYSATVTLRPSSRFQSEITLNTTRFTDVRTDVVDFDVKVVRAVTTYQFTPRLLIRNITDLNTLNKTFGLNVMGTYRVNAGTVFFVGYDDRYRQGQRIDAVLYTDDAYRRTNRALFAKVQYLFRR